MKWLMGTALCLALMVPANAAAPLLRFSFEEDPDYTVVNITGPHGEDIATLNENDFHNPVIYPAPDFDNAVIAGQTQFSDDPAYFDTLAYMLLRRVKGRHWAVLQCDTKRLFRIPEREDHGTRVDQIVRAALVRVLRQGKPIPGEKCEPAQEIQKGSRVY